MSVSRAVPITLLIAVPAAVLVIMGGVASKPRGLPSARPAAAESLPAQPAAAWASLFPPRIENLRRCDTFQTVVDVRDAVDLAAFQLEVDFDPAIVEFSAAAVALWLADQWPEYSELPPVTTEGSVLFAAASDDGTGAYGSGEIANLTFRAVGPGTTPLDLHSVRLIDGVGTVVAITSTGSTVHVLNQDGAGCLETRTATPTETPGGSETPSPGPSHTRTPTSSTTPTREPTPGSPVPTTPGPSPTDEPPTATRTSTPETPIGPPTAISTEPTSDTGQWRIHLPFAERL